MCVLTVVLLSDSQPDTMQQSPGKRLFLCLISGCGVRFNKLLSSGTNKQESCCFFTFDIVNFS